MGEGNPSHTRPSRSRALGPLAALSVIATFGCATTPIAERLDVIETAAVSSPSGAITLTVTAPEGLPSYAIAFRGEQVVEPSRLGFRFAEGPNLERNLALTNVVTTQNDATWEQPWGENRFVRDRYDGLIATFTDLEDPQRTYELEVRMFDAGAAFRYRVPGRGERVILDELTEFHVGAEPTAWWTPAGEFNRYEYIYETTPVGDTVVSHTPFTLRREGGVHMAIHEAALVDYSGMWLDQTRSGVLEAQLAPRYDGSKVVVEDGFTTPWRVVQIADDAPGLITGADIYLNLNEPNALGDVSYVKPGKYVGIWWGMHIGVNTWGSGPTHGATTENTKRYIDFAAEHGFIGVLVEGWNVGWDGDWYHNGDVFSFTEAYPDFDLPELSAYAAEKGVRLIGHHETSGNISNYEDQLEAAFDLYEAHGVRVVKTGYVADAGDLKYVGPDGHARFTYHDAQEAVDHHLRVIKAAHKRGIAINPHEPVKDTGLRRTYPNWVSREGARGMEYNAWGSPPNPPEHLAILPFTRMLSGPMDFTPGVFDLMPNGPDSENRIETTLAKQLASYVVIHSPVQMAADLPENYEARPEALQFIKDVAADWEETLALQGEVGEFVVMARRERGGPEWFLGAITDENARDIETPLSFLEPGVRYRAEIYRDGPDADWRSNPYALTIESKEVTAESKLSVRLATSGGLAVRFVPLN